VARRRTSLGTGDAARDKLLDAAEQCILCHGGVEKTTMEDVAHAVGVSRSTLYRYFPDREQLLVALILRRVKRIVYEAHQFVSGQPTFEDQIVEGLIFLAKYAHSDPFIRPIHRSDTLELTDPLLASAPSVEMTRDLWEPFVTAARESNQLRSGADGPNLYYWLNYVELIVAGRFAELPDAVDDHRKLIRHYVVPALTNLESGAGGRRRGAVSAAAAPAGVGSSATERAISSHGSSATKVGRRVRSRKS